MGVAKIKMIEDHAGHEKGKTYLTSSTQARQWEVLGKCKILTDKIEKPKG